LPPPTNQSPLQIAKPFFSPSPSSLPPLLRRQFLLPPLAQNQFTTATIYTPTLPLPPVASNHEARVVDTKGDVTNTTNNNSFNTMYSPPIP